MKRGRWYEAVAGPGLEIETGSSDPEFQWRVAGYVEVKGKRRPEFRVVINHQEESYCAVTKYTEEDAKQELLRIFGVTEVVNG